MLLATLLLLACNGDADDSTTEDTEIVLGTATRPIVEAVDSARDTGGTTGDTSETTTTTVVDPEVDCENEVDDDGDGLVDCLDPDCSFTPNCASEICGDGIDNEGDGLTDCLDPDCDAELSCDTSCADDVLTDPLPITYTGSTAGGGRDTNPSCATSTAADRAFAFVAPADGNYTFDTSGSAYDTVLYMYSGCAGQEVACNDDAGGTLQSQVAGPVRAGQVVIVIVDGYGDSEGNFRLNISN